MPELRKSRKLFVFPKPESDNHEILRIPHKSYENYQNLIIPIKNNENHEILRIPRNDHENHENLSIPLQN